ncbi:leucyl/phenylalanyl-tRNA--protein transferase [Lachnospiraceae bacterium KH1T2]|nr:leucyl/phenylalanyl-tRNA--protein transferase [Lachnospiraceae bacterium KH1T2]
MPVYRLDSDVWFPKPELAEDDGLLAVGGDLSIERLILAYSNGIFPWYNPGEEIVWWCPKKRFIIRPSEIHISHSMKKFFKHHDIKVEFNRDFADTMHRCRMKREHSEGGTWIGDDMEKAYQMLQKFGYAMSVESYIDGELAGGLYGVILGRCFFGESMFSDKENGSKIALIKLSQFLEANGFLMIDCQFHTPHLESMGGVYISWEEFKYNLEHMKWDEDDL